MKIAVITEGTVVAHEDPDGTKLWVGTVEKINRKTREATVQYWGRVGKNLVRVGTLKRAVDVDPGYIMRFACQAN